MKLHASTPKYLDLVRQHKQPYVTEVSGVELIIHPNVMSPAYDLAPAAFLKDVEGVVGKTILDVGTGCGVLGVLAALRGASRVDAVDINAAAVENAKENFSKYDVDGEVYSSNLFSELPRERTYDEIWFNAPYHSDSARDDLELGVTDPNYQTLDAFLALAQNHLSDKGIVRLGFSDTGDLSHLHDQMRRNAWRLQSRHERPIDDWVALHYELEKWSFETPEQRWMYYDDKKFFDWAKPHLTGKKTLKVGRGLGYLENMIEQEGGQVTIIGPEDYDGRHLPFEENEFDVALGVYMLHHAKHRDQLFREMTRVANNVIVAEETYSNPLNWAKLVLNDWHVNKKAKQKVTIRPFNYFAQGELTDRFLDAGWSVRRDRTERHKGVERLWLHARKQV